MRILFLVSILLVSFTGAAFGQCSDADKAALEALDKAWGEATQKGDRATLERFIADDFRALPGMGTKAEAITNAVNNAQQTGGTPAENVTWDRYIITCTPNSATITHRNVIVSNDGPGGRERTTWARSIHGLEKRGGRWQLVSTTGHEMDDEMALYYMDLDWTDANLRRDKAWYERNFADDFASVSSTDGNVFDKASDIEDTMNSKAKTEMTESTNQMIRVDRNVGVVIGIYHWKGTDENGKPFDNRVRYTDTYVKRDGRWQVLSTISVPIKAN
ncbi:MAG: nuclear transport factor 2 family protein [Aridibacter famidurans]|nr:nuclear transport factor 2 family protein [Aridibacter famidurans]